MKSNLNPQGQGDLFEWGKGHDRPKIYPRVETAREDIGYVDLRKAIHRTHLPKVEFYSKPDPCDRVTKEPTDEELMILAGIDPVVDPPSTPEELDEFFRGLHSLLENPSKGSH